MTQAAAVDQDVLCPLCDYNLRGLVEPRCPECGHRFDWAEMLDRDQWEHRWLFEHQSKRRFRAFYYTFWMSLLPWRFWKSVRPTHKPRLARLFGYWLVCASPVVFALSPYLLALILLKTGLWQTFITNFEDAYFSVVNIVPPAITLPAALICFSWPILTVLALMVFRATMRRARIKWVHVIRCVVYSGDVLSLFIVVALVMLSTTGLLWQSWGVLFRMAFVGWVPLSPIVILIAASWLLLTWRLATAYRMYLAFPSAILTCVLSQVVVWQFLFTVWVLWNTRDLWW
jgi:hypothetical protein